jgi:hypothetical protein
MAEWQLFTRNQFAGSSGGIPIIEADAVVRRIAAGKYVVEVGYSPSARRRLVPGCGVIIRREGKTVLSGPWTRFAYRGATADNPLGTIALEGVSDDIIGQYRLCAPDPTRPLDQQSTVNTWTRGPAPIETLMHQLVNENCGPGALVPSVAWPDAPSRRIPGLVMGADQGRGPVTTWSTLRYPTVQEELQRMSAFAEAAGVRLLPKFQQTDLGLTFEVLEADNRVGQVVFGPGLGNLDDQEYIEESGDVWLAVGAGKGEGVMRMQRVKVTEDEFTLAFGVGREEYVDRRDTAEWAELEKSAQEAVDRGVAAVSFRCTALDTPGTRYGEDFDLNTLASVKIGPPGIDPETGELYVPVAEFDDLVREIAFSRAADGTDKVTAAVGTETATTNVALPSLKKLAALNAQMTQLQRSQ